VLGRGGAFRESMAGMAQNRRLVLGVLAGGALLIAGAAGCGAPVVLEPATHRVERRSIVRVTVLEVAGDVLWFQVENLSKEPLVVMKGEIVVETYFGTMEHPPGTKAPVYEVAPGGKQKVGLKFTAKGLERGDEFRVHFDDAIRQQGQPVALDPVIFYVARSRG